MCSSSHPANDFIDYPNNQVNNLKSIVTIRTIRVQSINSYFLTKYFEIGICLKNVRVSKSKFPTKISLIGIIRLITRCQHVTAVSVNDLFLTKPKFFTVEKFTETFFFKKKQILKDFPSQLRFCCQLLRLEMIFHVE